MTVQDVRKEGGHSPVAVQITVVIVAYNSFDFLKPCLASLALQTHGSFCVVVADNGSDTGASAAPPLPDSRFRLVDMGGNIGFAAANNRVIFSATSDYVVLLNPDTTVEPDWLERLVAAAEARPDAASVGSTLVSLSSPDLLDGLGDVWHVAGLAWREGQGLPVAGARMGGEIFGACAAGALYRRQAVVAVGGFDERYFCYFEDVDLALRLRLAGWCAVHAADAVVYHAGSGIAGLQSYFSLFHGHRNRIWTFLKNTPGVWFWLLLPYHLAFDAVFLLGAAKSGIFRPVWDGYRAAWAGRAPFLKERVRLRGTRAYTRALRVMATSPWSPWTRLLRLAR